MSDVLVLAAIVMLVLLFLKVPVYIAVLGGSMVYFVMNPGINSVVFAQQAIIDTDLIICCGDHSAARSLDVFFFIPCREGDHILAAEVPASGVGV